MKTNFRLSVSIQNFTNKNTIIWNSIKYQQQDLSLDEFTELIKRGHCFCHCFRTPNLIFGVKDKRDKNFLSAQVVFLDFDDIDIPMKEFISALLQKPTIAYTTPNNYTREHNWKFRFRLCYLFDEPITSISEYKALYNGIIESIRNVLPDFSMKDNCGRSVSQQFGGNANGNIELFKTDYIYNKYDFPFENNNVSFLFLYKSETEKQIRKTREIVIADEAFISDVKNLNSTDLIRKYRDCYPYFDRTKLNFEDGYALLPDDYQKIYRSWYRDTLEKTNGDIINLTKIKKHRDGDRRRKKLFIAGLIMKKIMPTITFEHLLFNLICERTWHYDNSDGVITNSVLSDIAKNIINIPIEEISLQSRHKKKFIIDKAYCVEHGISPNKMKNIVRKKLKDEEIGNLYDVSKSVKENLEDLRQMGIKVSKTKLYDWCQEKGIGTKGHKIISEPTDFLSSFSKERVRLIVEEQDTLIRYFIADDSKKKEILQSQYFELLKAIREVA